MIIRYTETITRTCEVDVDEALLLEHESLADYINDLSYHKYLFDGDRNTYHFIISDPTDIQTSEISEDKVIDLEQYAEEKNLNKNIIKEYLKCNYTK